MVDIYTLTEEVERLKAEVDRLRKELSSSLRDEWVSEDDMREKWQPLLQAAKVVQHGDSDSDKPYKALREAIAACEEVDHEDAKHIDRLSCEVDLLRKQNWDARQRIGTLENEVDRLRKELDRRMHIDVWLNMADHRVEQTKWDTLLAAAKLIIQRDDHAMLDGGISLYELEEAVGACEEVNHEDE